MVAITVAAWQVATPFIAAARYAHAVLATGAVFTLGFATLSAILRLLQWAQERRGRPRYFVVGGPPVRPAFLEIDLDAVRHNVRVIQRMIPERTAIAAIVKANAYGHGGPGLARLPRGRGEAAVRRHRGRGHRAARRRPRRPGADPPPGGSTAEAEVQSATTSSRP